jgi:hypothetical protein
MEQSEIPQDASALYTQVSDRHKWLKDNWLNEATKIQEIYQGDKAEETPFNILYSNTEILVPAIFSRVPTPVVQRRHDTTKQDLPAKATAKFLEYVMDTNLPGYPAFIDAIESSILDAALPGLGQTRVRLVEGIPQLDYVHFDAFVWGYARRWESVPWIAYKHDMTRADMQSTFGLTEEQMLGFTDPEDDGSDKSAKEATHCVYEVWDKRTKEIRFVCDDYPGSLLKTLPDTLGLHGFFDCPTPLVFVLSTGDIKPRPLYNLYKKQAEELNAVSMRIKRVTQAIRVRGIYNGNLQEMAQIFADGANENQLIPAEKPSILANDGGLDRQIWMVPIEKLIIVLQQLFLIREQIKSTIYEILGIGDILRGTSKASETLGAQEIKDKWGSLRINKMRDKTARYIRSTLRLMAEVGAKHSPEEVWEAATGLNLVPKMQAMIMQQSGAQPPGPTWESVLSALRDDLQRSYTIDIETNSTVDSEATQDKQEASEFMNALGQAMAGLAPLAQLGDEGFNATKALIIEFMKKFRMGADTQAVIENLKPPPKPQGPPPEVMEKLQQREQELQKAEEMLRADQDKLTQGMAKLEATFKDVQTAMQRFELSKKGVEREIDLDAREQLLVVKEQAVAVKVLGLNIKAQEVNKIAEDAERRLATSTSQREASESTAQFVSDGLAKMPELLATLVEVTQQAMETSEATLAQLKSRGKARFTQADDGSVVKEYIN